MHLWRNIILVVSFALTLVAGHVCHKDWPFNNADFTVTCSKDRYLKVEIICKSGPEAWSNFTPEKLNLRIVKNTVFRNCSFPVDLELLSLTTLLGIGKIDTLTFEESRSSLDRQNLRGLTTTSLQFFNNNNSNNNSELPYDLVHEIGLEDLVIDNVGLKGIPGRFFSNSTILRCLEITNNNLTKLENDDLAGLKSLKDLLLFGNQLQEIEPGTFDQLVNLRVLELSKNRLKTLPAGLLRNLVRLERINLGENELASLPADLLRIENSRLQRVRLNHNRGDLATLPNRFFSNLTSLSCVILTSNNFASLPADLFLGATTLRQLSLAMNNLTSLPADIFKSTHSLVELSLTQNKLESLPSRIFEDVKLEKLDLSFNRLTNLPSSALVGLSNLLILEVSHNNLTYIDQDICKYMKKLEDLDLSYNQLTLMKQNTSSGSIFENCFNIVNLNLSYNKISKLLDVWTVNGNLRNLNLDGNQITYVKVSDVFMMNPNQNLYLMHNQITTVDLADIDELVKKNQANRIHSPDNNYIAVIFLKHNPLNCDCNLFHFFEYMHRKLSDEVYDYVKLFVDDVKCASPPRFQKLSIVNVSSDELNCPARSNNRSDACNETCVCWDYPGKNVLSVDCSRRNLTSLPVLVVNPHNRSIELNMTGNRLRETPLLHGYSYLANVTALDLSANQIDTVTTDVFSSSSLKKLWLHNNSISRLEPEIVQHISTDTTLRNLTLHGNRWLCDCETRHFLSVVQKKLTSLELHDVMCYGTNRRLSAMTVKELCESTVVTVVVVSLLIAFFGLVMGVLAALYYRYQKEIKIWLYSKQCCLWLVTEEELDRDKRYDAFISYSHKDEDFVVREIVARLEQGPRPYKLCLHYRDWPVGEWIPSQISRSVDDSRRTIVVLSPNFLESVWAKMEFRTAHSQALSEGRARVIIILYGNIGNTEDLEPQLEAYLNTNTYIRWGDPWFWDKLRYALPHRSASNCQTPNTHLIKNQLSHLMASKHEIDCRAEFIPLPKITTSSNDMEKLIDIDIRD